MNFCMYVENKKTFARQYLCTAGDLVDRCTHNKLGYKGHSYCNAKCEGRFCSNQVARRGAKEIKREE